MVGLRHLLLALPLAWLGCGGCSSEDGQGPPTASSAAPEGDREVLSLIDALRICDVDHRGLLIDLGTDALIGRFRNRLDAPAGVAATQHDGATWSRIHDREVELSFYQPQVAPVFVSLRAIGRSADRVSIYLDGFLLGTLKLTRDEIKVASTTLTSLPADQGQHALTLRFPARPKSDTQPLAEVDWLRIGVPDELERTYGAPTLQDILAPAAELGGVPHRAIALRAPGLIRCPVRVPPHGKLRLSVGMRGSGNATATVAVLADGKAVDELERVEVSGGADARWTDFQVSLAEYASRLVTLELGAVRTTGTGRLLFGDPVMLVPAQPAPKTPSARAAVIVILDGVQKIDLPPWRETETPHLPSLNQLVRNATVFDDHRAPSTLVAATVASLLSGLSPELHSLGDNGARLPASVPTMANLARDGSVPAAMFSAVPTTFEPFGFAGRWDKFEQYAPNGGRPASAAFEDAASWLLAAHEEETKPARPMLTVIHARGGHPPWDVTPEESAKLPPADYAGLLGPRRAAQLLAKLGGPGRLTESDRERLDGLYFAGLSGQDRALGKLIHALEDAGRWDATLLVVTGDVASARQTLFADGAELDDDLLDLPLYVHFPGGAHAGKRVSHPTEIYDVTRTALAALGLEPPKDARGRDLAAIAADLEDATDLVRVAYVQDQYSARWGDYALIGRNDRAPKLCRLSVDPSCAIDRSELLPIASLVMQRRLALLLERRPRERAAREPLTVEPEMADMLKVWGAL